MSDIENNIALLKKIDSIDPDKFDLNQFKYLCKVGGITIKEFNEALGIHTNQISREVENNEGGYLDSKYFIFIIGMIVLKENTSLNIIKK